MKSLPVLAALSMVLVTSASVAQNPAGAAFPNKSVRMVVPFSAGGPSDVMGRILGQRLSDLWKVPVVIDNRPGASGTIAGELVRRSPPDGYTLFFAGPSSTTALEAVNPKMIPYSSIKDFAPVSVVGSFPNVLAVNPGLGVKTLPAFIKLVKDNPGKYSYSSSGAGTASHLFAELFKSMAGLEILHVPYQGLGPGLNAVVGGQVSMSLAPIVSVAPLAEAGRLVPLGVTTPRRTVEMPAVPTIDETVKGFVVDSWIGLIAAPGTPIQLARKIAEDVRVVVHLPEVVERFRTLGLIPVGSTPEAMLNTMTVDLDRWQRVVKSANIKVE